MEFEGAVTKVSGWRWFLLALQHFVAMFGATVLVPLITGLDPLVALLTAGIGTLIFHFVTGGIVPVFLGSSFAFIAPILAVKEIYGDLAYATGGIFVAGLFYVLYALIVKAVGPEKVKKILPPVVTGSMIMVIGLTLSPVAIQMASSDWPLALIVIATVVFVSTMTRGFFSMVPVITGVVVGYVAGLFMGKIDTSVIVSTPLFSVPKVMLPKFDYGAIFMIVPVTLATFMEHLGDITTNGAVVGKNFFDKPGLHRTLLGDGLATAVAGLLGGPANTTYSENTGVLALTRVYDPSVLRGAALVAIFAAFVSKFGAILQTIPQAVMGGVSLILFGMITSVGVRTMVNAEVDFSKPRNLMITALMLTVGIGGAVLKVGRVELKGIGLAALVGIFLNLILPDRD
ncbi:MULTISPECIES: uracil-xanthine permease family protein [Thermotoga]|uniref:Uracil permease n=3 Tax=Thermotoga TaxID=2335 RepID=Q9WZS6_THEMA|nr:MULTISPECIES: solute carrier family 23 protein [Thermotoga]KUK33166.1 MAG: Uracil-xanthine permease [Thermotoga sp. 47_83]MBZ4660995.1 transporter permease [Thermotoga sp.]HAA82844.1 uracil permease [Thermotoga petrophila]AAD35901.1 uracil permease [Thermotoga maritima MSB8]ABQ46137.1 uracil-xanthine permease [Thermotoga petrophila RKU-1]